MNPQTGTYVYVRFLVADHNRKRAERELQETLEAGLGASGWRNIEKTPVILDVHGAVILGIKDGRD